MKKTTTWKARRKPWQLRLPTEVQRTWDQEWLVSWLDHARASQQPRYQTRRARKAARARELAVMWWREARYQRLRARSWQGMSCEQRRSLMLGHRPSLPR